MSNPDHTPSTAPLAITMGDPAGIGPEIIVKMAGDELARAAPFVVVGDAQTLRRAARIAGLDMSVQVVTAAAEAGISSGVLYVLQTGPDLPPDLTFGRVDARTGAASYAYVARGIDLALAGEVSGLVTAPINKEALRAAGLPQPGHTEILAERTGARDVAMMLANDELRVLLVSIHVPLLEAIQAVTLDNELRAIRLAHEACRAFGVAWPRVAVAGLNPHASENGLFGREDLDVIAPAVHLARAEGMNATGPWPPDTVFMRARRGEFDIVVAQYHDQGLIPVKYLGIDHGVNITVGLPFVRTSVDHGTAYDIAGTGRADHASLACALKQAAALTVARAGMKPAPVRAAAAGVEPGTPDFVFMLTRHDRTIPDAHERLKEVLAAGVRHIGFKDVGLPLTELQGLAEAIRQAGARAYLEVVSLDERSEVASARAAVSLEVDVLMGGTRPGAVLPVLAGTGIHYYPFPGRIVGHPSRLEGTADEIVTSARALAALDGVHGLDLLAYRFDGDVPDLIARVCAAVDKPVVIAGSIDRTERVAAVVRGGAAGFTVGTAALNGAFPASGRDLPTQLAAITAALAAAPRGRATLNGSAA